MDRCSAQNSRRSGETGAVTNMGGADSAGRSAQISTTSTVPPVPHGRQVRCPNSRRSGETGAVTNKGGAIRRVESAAISTTSTISAGATSAPRRGCRRPARCVDDSEPELLLSSTFLRLEHLRCISQRFHVLRKTLHASLMLESHLDATAFAWQLVTPPKLTNSSQPPRDRFSQHQQRREFSHVRLRFLQSPVE